MRLLIFFVCFLFSFIFYAFYHINSWQRFFWYRLDRIRLESLTWNLMIETSLFILFWILLILYFSPNLKPNFIIEKVEKNKKNFYIWFYFLIFLSLISWKIYLDIFVLFWLIFLIFSDFCFNYLSNIDYFKEQKENLRYFWLFLNIWAVFIWLYYIFNFNFSLILILVLIFSTFFNYFIYKRYKNILCLWVVYTIIIFILLFLILKLYYLGKFILTF